MSGVILLVPALAWISSRGPTTWWPGSNLGAFYFPVEVSASLSQLSRDSSFPT